ncbi:MAG: T9SS type A sorting domain-containing protein [Bacteroidetes bacterium]|nr:T9SS type A sorting domain-containing protein [Bacteroidota bacterium]
MALGSYDGVIYSHSQYNAIDTDCSQYGIRDSIRFSFTVTEPTGLETMPQTDLIITPNPTSGQLFLSHRTDDAQVIVQDLNGHNYYLPHTGREIDVSSLAAGVYVLRLQTREGSVSRRFVKE